MVKFLVFADFHYKKGMYTPAVSDLEKIFRRAHDEGAEFVVHLGDFSNDYKGSPEAIDAYLNNPYGLPVYGVFGNHELESKNLMSFVTPRLCNRKVNWGEGERVAYWSTDVGNFRLIGLDTNYSRRPDGVWEHNLDCSSGARSGNVDYNNLGPEQRAWLYETIEDARKKGKKVLTFSHAGFAGTFSSSSDDEEVRKIFASFPGTVILATSGHLHTDHFDVVENIAYWDVNVCLNGGWRPHENYHYTDDMTFLFQDYDEEGKPKGKAFQRAMNSFGSSARSTWFFTEPLSAMVTVTEEGEIEIEGAETRWLYDIEPDWTESGMVPYISSHKIKLDLPK